jgi:predicted ribosomally synthesized peptide with nif11-like leader
MSKEDAKQFFERLEKDAALRRNVKQGLEKVAKDAGFDVTEDELSAELRRLWGARERQKIVYSEPPGF